jgi:hypothetical protein
LCTRARDKASLAIGMTGLLLEHISHARVREASKLASEHMALIESIGDATLTVGLSWAAIFANIEAGGTADVLSWSRNVIDLSDGDPAKGGFIIGSPSTMALASQGSPDDMTATGSDTKPFRDGHGRLATDMAIAVAFHRCGESQRRASDTSSCPRDTLRQNRFATSNP